MPMLSRHDTPGNRKATQASESPASQWKMRRMTLTVGAQEIRTKTFCFALAKKKNLE